MMRLGISPVRLEISGDGADVLRKIFLDGIDLLAKFLVNGIIFFVEDVDLEIAELQGKYLKGLVSRPFAALSQATYPSAFKMTSPNARKSPRRVS